MTINATFPAGVNEITVNGLHQWDYGRTLRIEAADLPAIVEVHFACPGMKEAIVRACESADGVAEAVIPEKCLEQTAPITAWVFAINDTEGMTIKTITLTITPRTRPQPGATVPERYTDKYTELIAAVTDLVDELKSGDLDGIVGTDVVHKSGDTMTGRLLMPASSGVYHRDGAYSNYAYYDSYGNSRGELMITDKNCFHVNQRKTGAAYAERYKLPDLPTEDLTADEWYGIHTTKQPIEIRHGGTGGATAAEARQKLGVPSTQDITSGVVVAGEAYRARTLAPDILYFEKAGNGPSTFYSYDKGVFVPGLYLVEFRYAQEDSNDWADGLSLLSIRDVAHDASGTMSSLGWYVASIVYGHAFYKPVLGTDGSVLSASIGVECADKELGYQLGLYSVQRLQNYS